MHINYIYDIQDHLMKGYILNIITIHDNNQTKFEPGIHKKI